MKGKIVNAKEAIEEMLSGEIVRALNDKETFFAYHEERDMIFMIHFDNITNRMNIAPIDQPLKIINDGNGFLQGYGEDKFIVYTFGEIFNDFNINPFRYANQSNLSSKYNLITREDK